MSDNPYGSPQHAGTTLGPTYSSQQPPSTGLAITSMVLGIVGIVFDCCCWPVGAALGIAAIITGVIGLNKVKDGSGGGKGMAMTGLICGIAAILLGIASLILGLVMQEHMPDIMKWAEQMQQQQNR
jgi:hypothetical protein